MIAKTNTIFWQELIATLAALVASSIPSLSFVVAATGIVSMHTLGQEAILPAVILWISLVVVSHFLGWQNLYKDMVFTIFAGTASVVAMEIVRIIGFRVFHRMPGSLPMLLGVLLTNQFAQGPNWWSNIIGWGDHLFNGLSFVLIYLIIFGRQRWWVAIFYVIGIATIFMLSPVMNFLGAGIFGRDFAPIRFPLAVYAAHIAYVPCIWIVGTTVVFNTR